MGFDEDSPVPPNGQMVCRLRHEQGWSPEDLLRAVADANWASTGIRESISPSALAGIEERNERVPYATLCLLAAGLDCDPVSLLREGAFDGEATPEAEPPGRA